MLLYILQNITYKKLSFLGNSCTMYHFRTLLLSSGTNVPATQVHIFPLLTAGNVKVWNWNALQHFNILTKFLENWPNGPKLKGCRHTHANKCASMHENIQAHMLTHTHPTTAQHNTFPFRKISTLKARNHSLLTQPPKKVCNSLQNKSRLPRITGIYAIQRCYYKPILNASTKVLWCLNTNHNECHKEEECWKGKAEAIHCQIPHSRFTLPWWVKGHSTWIIELTEWYLENKVTHLYNFSYRHLW